MREPRTTIALPTALAAWLSAEARANGMSASAYVTALIWREKGVQAAELTTATARLEKALRLAERLLCELAGTTTQLPEVSENARRRIGEAFTAFTAALEKEGE